MQLDRGGYEAVNVKDFEFELNSKENTTPQSEGDVLDIPFSSATDKSELEEIAALKKEVVKRTMSKAKSG